MLYPSTAQEGSCNNNKQHERYLWNLDYTDKYCSDHTHPFLTLSCWMDTGSSIWWLGALVVVVMVVNLVFVINVIRVIKRKRVLQAAVQATEERAANLK